VCDIATLADPGRLRRFAYQATVIVDVQEPLIAGTIRWRTGVTTLQRQSDLFSLHAHFVETIPGGVGLAPPSIVRTVGSGQETEPPATTSGYSVVPYVLRGDLPLNTGITVSVDAENGAFSTAPKGLAFTQIAGPTPVLLSPSQPQVFGVDFEMFAVRDVR
jgi:hypothetical protein